MKYAVMARFSFSTKLQKDNVAKGIKEMIANKILWADALNPTTITEGVSKEGKPTVSIVARFDSKDERDEVALFLEDKIARIPALSGEVKCHRCFHDESPNKPCEPEMI